MIIWPEEGTPWKAWMIGVNLGFYSLVIIILLYLFLIIKYRVYHPFWSKQPVFQNLNLFWWVNPPGIIQSPFIEAPLTSYYDPWAVQLFQLDSGWIPEQYSITTRKQNSVDTTDNLKMGSSVRTATPNSPTSSTSNWMRGSFPIGQIHTDPHQTTTALKNAWNLVCGHYLRHPGLAEYKPSWEQFISHCKSHSFNSHLSICYKSNTALEPNPNSSAKMVIKYDKPVSCMLTRPVECRLLHLKKSMKSMKSSINVIEPQQTQVLSNVGYVDFLCTHNEYRKQSITPKLIYTHYKLLKDSCAKEMKANTSITSKINKMKDGKIATASYPSVFLFKREGELAPFMPLVVYHSFCFDTLYWPIAGMRHGVEATVIDSSHFALFVRALEHIQSDSTNLDLHIQANIANLKEQIKVGLLMPIVFVRNTDKIAPFIGVAILRWSGTTFRTAGMTELIATYMSGYSERTPEQRRWFAMMVRDVCVHLMHRKKSRYLLIEDIGHTKEILSELNGKFMPQFESPTAYYFYNYATYPTDKHRSWILC